MLVVISDTDCTHEPNAHTRIRNVAIHSLMFERVMLIEKVHCHLVFHSCSVASQNNYLRECFEFNTTDYRPTEKSKLRLKMEVNRYVHFDGLKAK